MIHLLKEVGRGKRGARDLTYEESLEAAEAIMSLKATPAQIGAFFMAERIKMESVEELEAFVTVCRNKAQREGIQEGIDCAGPYDGRKKTFYATFPTAFVLAAAGLSVTLHGTSSLPPKWGTTVHDMLRLMGIDPDTADREVWIRAAKETGVLYAAAEQWCPPLKALRPIREELGMRTVLNTAEKLIDFSRSPYLVFGIFHNTVVERLTQLLTRLNYRKAIIVQGAEGSEDLFIDRPTRNFIVENGANTLQVIDPESLGLETPVPDLAWTADVHLQISEAVLRGEADLSFIHQVLLNAAFRLHHFGRAGSLEEALNTCKGLLDSRAPWDLYEKWKRSLIGG